MFFRRTPPDFKGYLDGFADDQLTGWVWNSRQPKTRPQVEIYAAGQRLGRVQADQFRDDLAQAKIGDGRYGFRFSLPAGDYPVESLAAKVEGADFWLLNNFFKEPDSFLNSTLRGLPLLRPGWSTRIADDTDIEIAAELQRAWREAMGTQAVHGLADRKTMWGDIVLSRHAQLLRLLDGTNAPALAAYLVEVHRHPESEGLVQGARAYHDFAAASPEGRRAAIAPFHDMLVSLAQYMGLERAECGEQNYLGATTAIDQEILARTIEQALKFEIAPPCVFDGLSGLALGGGVLHGRDIQALYAALRAIEASQKASPRICEIGGGFGQVAYYAVRLGVARHIIIDLPTVSAMQYFYLRRALPQTEVRFGASSKDETPQARVNLIFASTLDNDITLQADVALNCDSFPEMGDAICRSYFKRIPDWAPLLLSINQEANREIRGADNRQTVVGEIAKEEAYLRCYRFRSWVRKGYIEELWKTRGDAYGNSPEVSDKPSTKP